MLLLASSPSLEMIAAAFSTISIFSRRYLSSCEDFPYDSWDTWKLKGLSGEALTFSPALIWSGFAVTVYHGVCREHISLPSVVFHPPALRLCGVRARGAAECPWLAPRTTGWEGSVCIYILSSHRAPRGAHYTGLRCVAAQQILRQLLL